MSTERRPSYVDLYPEEAKKMEYADNEPAAPEPDWVVKVRAEQESKGLPTETEVKGIREQFSDFARMDADKLYRVIPILRALAGGVAVSDEDRETMKWDPMFENPEVIDRFGPVEYRQLLDASGFGEMDDWVREAEADKTREGGPTEERIQSDLDFYLERIREKKQAHAFWRAGQPGRDLIYFALGQKVMGFSPVDMAPHFRNFTPEDFGRIVDTLLDEANKK